MGSVLHTLQTNLNHHVLSCHKMYKICRTTYTWPNEYIKQKVSVNIAHSYSKKVLPFHSTQQELQLPAEHNFCVIPDNTILKIS
jgi:hypothetical protein